MSLAATTYLLLVRPTPGGDSDVWGAGLNTLVGLIDAHRHVTGEGRQIPSAGIGIDNPLSMNNFRLTSVAGVALQNLGAVITTGANEIFASGGNVYFRNNGGTNVQLTNGSTLAMTTVGGIGGDYTAVGAAVEFTDGTDTYTFKQQVGAAVRQWGKAGHADLQLYEYIAHPAAAPPTNAVTIKSPAALAAPYSLTMLAALPATTRPLLVSSAGVMSAPAPVDQVRVFSPLAATNIIAAGTWIPNPAGDGSVWIISTGAGRAYLGCHFNAGERITSMTVALFGDASVDGLITVSHTTAAGVGTTLGTATLNNVPFGWADTVIDLTDTTITDGAVTVTFSAAAAGLAVGPVRFTYGVPAYDGH